MTDKKKRQRGSRTHGGGSQKNRRGAGNRGGRGRAGSTKHEARNYEVFEKHGFTRPPELEQEVEEVDIQKIDENIAVYAADGVADETDEGYQIDARDIIEDGYSVDAVKVLGSGQVRHALEVTADAFSETAVERIEAAGGSVTRTEPETDEESE